MRITKARRWRRGMSAMEGAFVLGFITLAIVGFVRIMGQNSSADLNRTAGDVGDPTKLVERFDH